MTVANFFKDAARHYSKYGPSGLKYIAQDLRRGLAARRGLLSPPPMYNMIDEDFDLLVVLDACRFDLMESVVDEYDWAHMMRPYVAASSSQEWISRTFMTRDSPLPFAVADLWPELTDPGRYAEHFETDLLDDVAYVTWNPYSAMLDGDRFGRFEEVWRGKEASETIEPRDMTDAVVSLMRGGWDGRVVVHYQQPHLPFRDEDDEDFEDSAWERYQRGELDYGKMWAMYQDNLRWAMDDISLLLENVDASSVAVTADHGNALGEGGMYGHFPYVDNPGMKIVPWIDAGRAEDSGGHEPTVTVGERSSVNERLEHLGYR